MSMTRRSCMSALTNPRRRSAAIVAATGAVVTIGALLPLVPAQAAVSVAVDHFASVQGTALSIATTQPNEVILVSSSGFPGGRTPTATVDGAAATLIASASDLGSDDSVYSFVASTPGSHAVAITGGNHWDPYNETAVVSLLNATTDGITSAT